MNALEKSIQHWERLVKCKTYDEVEDEGYQSESCALCLLYLHKDCKRCPVQIRAKDTGCNGTPYFNAFGYMCAVEFDGNDFNPKKWRKFAMKELNFLRSLRK